MNTFSKFLAASLLASGLSAMAATDIKPVITAMDMAHSEQGQEALFVSYTLDRKAWKVPSNREVILTPVVKFGNDSVVLTPLWLCGRNAYLAHKRNDDVPKGVELLTAKGDTLTRVARLPWKESMMKPTLTFRSETRGCRCKEEDNTTLPQSLAADFTPKTFELIVPENQLAAMEQKVDEVVKTRSLSRRAYVNYKVNSTVLLPDFRSNPLELASILASIDSVRNDKDLTVDLVTIHGFASPEGSYELNTRLAKGRTEALRNYVDKQYGFGQTLKTDYTPEDWAGLRSWVAASTLANRQGILDIIDSDLNPDRKDASIKKNFPADYQVLLSQVYPTLRRADYRIDYTVRTFTEPATINELLQSDPSKLSMEELMLLARTYDEGSDRRSELLFQAAELFPTDPRAQLNAAFAALGRGDLDRAERLLSKCDDSAVATYARGVLALYRGDKEKARELLTVAANAGVEGASDALKTL